MNLKLICGWYNQNNLEKEELSQRISQFVLCCLVEYHRLGNFDEEIFTGSWIWSLASIRLRDQRLLECLLAALSHVGVENSKCASASEKKRARKAQAYWCIRNTLSNISINPQPNNLSQDSALLHRGLNFHDMFFGGHTQTITKNSCISTPKPITVMKIVCHWATGKRQRYKSMEEN